MGNPEHILHVQVQADQLPNGKYAPRINVVQQRGRRWTSIALTLEAGGEFDIREEAVAFGKQSGAEELQKEYPQAEINIRE